jgi:glycosyltransferase involved in cell wall biosynthesis
MMENNKKVSFCLFTYNQEEYVQEAFESVLKQEYSPLEIIISDDCSTDSTCQIIEGVIERYKGPNKIIFNRNEKNMGVSAHFSKVCELATGDYFILLACDDVSKENHIQTAVSYINKYSDVFMVDFNGRIINGEGEDRGIYQDLKFKEKKFTLNDYLNLNSISTFAPGRIMSRELMSNFGPISKNCPTEDSVLVLRTLMLGSLLRVNEDLILYRRHDNNVSSAGNLHKISNLSIVAQYYRDLLKFYDDKKIDDKGFERLFKRIGLEYKLRKLKFDGKKSKLNTLSKVIRIKLLNIVYKR